MISAERQGSKKPRKPDKGSIYRTSYLLQKTIKKVLRGSDQARC
jgi:hypothetical protein